MVLVQRVDGLRTAVRQLAAVLMQTVADVAPGCVRTEGRQICLAGGLNRRTALLPRLHFLRARRGNLVGMIMQALVELLPRARIRA